MARDQAEKGGGIWLKTLLFVVLAMGGIAAASVIVQPMLVAPSSDVVLIKAEPGPFREKPKVPGGTKIPHKDSTVMGMLGGMVDQQEDVEILRPPADVPEMPPLPEKSDDDIVMAPAPSPVERTDDAGTAADTGAAKVAAESSVTDNATSETAPAQPATAAAGDAAGSDTEQVQTAKRDGEGAAESQTPSAGTDEASMPAPETMPQSKPKVPKGPAVEGDEPLYLVQLAAFRNATTAREQAAMLFGKHQTRLGGTELGTMKVDAGENGIFWRVITEPLQRETADSLCSALKRAGQDCILRKFDQPAS